LTVYLCQSLLLPPTPFSTLHTRGIGPATNLLVTPVDMCLFPSSIPAPPSFYPLHFLPFLFIEFTKESPNFFSTPLAPKSPFPPHVQRQFFQPRYVFFRATTETATRRNEAFRDFSCRSLPFAFSILILIQDPFQPTFSSHPFGLYQSKPQTLYPALPPLSPFPFISPKTR